MLTKFAVQSTFHHFIVLFSCWTLVYSIKTYDGTVTLRNSTGHTDVVPYREWPYDSGLSYLGEEGVILNADPLDACVPILGPNSTSHSLDFFVLISENSCDYDTKVLHSQLAGYRLAVIYKSNGSSVNETKQRWDVTPTIPVIIISENSSAVVREYLYSIDKNFIITIQDNGAQTFSSAIQVYVITSIVIFILYKGVFKPIVSSCTCNSRTSNSPTSNYPTSDPQTSVNHLLRQLETFRFTWGYARQRCVICMEEFKFLQKIRILPCSHGFHAKCIDPWLQSYRRTCPLCIQNVSVPEGSESQATETTPLLRNSNTSVNGDNV